MKRVCYLGKVCYPSAPDARKDADAMEGKQGEPFIIFWHDECRSWHVAHLMKTVARMRKDREAGIYQDRVPPRK